MARSRVLSFISQFGGPSRSSSPSSPISNGRPENGTPSPWSTSTAPAPNYYARDPSTTPSRSRVGERPSSRPMSMVQTYHPPLMKVAQDTPPELQPIFTFLNAHSNKLYQEGYFLKLNDLDSHGRLNTDRTWTECFAQLVGTVLSLWDAAALDAAGEDGEILPTFINLTDASIKMIETLPIQSDDGRALQNVLSVSTAGQNRYLFHFSSLHALTQWAAGIRLAMFEHATLQELYTGSLIAGKGKHLNNIRAIMERSRIKTEDWVRVRFGAGTPWRRCWCVISPADEKEYQKLQKQAKKRSAYDRNHLLSPRGDVKFYATKKTKKTRAIATITDAYSAYAIYPHSKPLIDQSTLIKVEGTITIHSPPASTAEGFVFVMPEVHPAVSGFEMMLRWLFPAFDAFALYGRPTKLIADTMDVHGMMFAMPKDRRYGYLEILDVAGLIHTDGSQHWKEADWRRKMKDLTAKRIAALTASAPDGRSGRPSTRSSLQLPARRSVIQFDEPSSTRSSPVRHAPAIAPPPPPPPPPPSSLDRTGTGSPFQPSPPTLPVLAYSSPSSSFSPLRHHRSVSEAQGGIIRRPVPMVDDVVDDDDDAAPSPPPPPPHAIISLKSPPGIVGPHATRDDHHDVVGIRRTSSDTDTPVRPSWDEPIPNRPLASPPEPVAAPPAFAHAPGTKPASRPYHSPELRRAKSRMSTATLSQLAGANPVAEAATTAARRPTSSESTIAEARAEEQSGFARGYGRRGSNPSVIPTPDGMSAGAPGLVGPHERWMNRDGSSQDVVRPSMDSTPSDRPMSSQPPVEWAPSSAMYPDTYRRPSSDVRPMWTPRHDLPPVPPPPPSSGSGSSSRPSSARVWSQVHPLDPPPSHHVVDEASILPPVVLPPRRYL